MKITLDLTEDQWSELFHAVETKALRVSEGEYGEDEENWGETLDNLRDNVGRALDEKGVVY